MEKSVVFERIKALYLKIEHNENQRRNTFNTDEREKFTANVKSLWAEIDDILDGYNVHKKFSQNIIQ